ncbi:hypothetical protein O181_028192 [Austropuccinia psidii MF-1]|uniref:Uncharacterized protein n=1 Tax=Austropuccinia psidii MF-1 TaxID=1389203 RepID=A0A9Q3CU30_9BASI|nr:hypothetical protein [Austropuccinia psidii MF-1]
MTAKKWTPIATQINKKPQNSASIQGKPMLTTCTGKITIINPAIASKGKLPKSADKKFVQGTVKETLSSKRTNHSTDKDCPEPADLEEDTLDKVHGKQDVQPGIPLGRTKSKLPQDLSQRPYGDHQRGNPARNYRRTADPGREYSNSFRLTRSKLNDLSSGFAQFRKQQISAQELPFFTIPESFQENTRIQGKKEDHLQPKEERFRPNDPEASEFGEGSAQEPEVVVSSSRISSPLNRFITPTQIEHNVVTPESNLKSDALWLKMCQYSEQNQRQFAELEASHERMKIVTTSMDKTVKKNSRRT